ncbi:MAG: GTP-binding protein TypA [Candidatus Zambryskibacteria bacterium RIFCSPHIGHO2_01_FULL_43_27]|uniref:50S ribosomal subunit assembly factor BipA n=1 Tax=Candidatus Zambryskibacteria bacterium RIFCSPLOWO2_01_FULL_43_17 TaxID=1802760 RepID=A0A1G2U5Z8_9BACT|nr:MAG: GTP-binding protein TypA [Candidatus Zambryskibacteria bacterium RIFCSPHIGHO2_01_FULL_43_27]OHA99578.1 MAG: GTP-binding protein TypA [Candidatus Zambryskibacteria bacterium RIFCSPHIGHO2_12_FULL_43_12b]OHB04906.1 MAG: GTP-binding protein TypA [Candidatus Zambryskibacteria bacterium RIFCSPLOWO2_01_FULL_43_17]
MEIRNIAIIAHVDHGKTTLTDALMRQTGMVEEGVTMDSNALEQERGITIYAKNTSVFYKDTKINIVDTPGHSDFGSEVERVLRSIDTVLLVVDAQEGPMPQTRFVLKKSLELGLKPIVVINKIDKPAARPEVVHELVLELFMELGASDEQLDFTTVYAIGRDGIAKRNLKDESKDLFPLLDVILEEVAPANEKKDAPAKLQSFNLAYDNFLGRMAICRIYEGSVKNGQIVFVKEPNGNTYSGKITKLYTFEGVTKKEVAEAHSGDIVMIAGFPNIFIGETISGEEKGEIMPAINIDEPTISLNFLVNDSPFAGKEGKFVTGRQIKERLEKELEVNVGLKVDFASGDYITVYGRGELHIAILLENMRREGYELQVSQPQVIIKEENDVKMEPYEETVIDVPEEFSGAIISKLTERRGILMNMKKEHDNQVRLIFEVPTRALLGYRGQFIIDTKGLGIISSRFIAFREHAGEIRKQSYGSMISMESGKALAFALDNLQQRGTLYIEPAAEIYEGQVIGNVTKGEDMYVNPTKGKQLTNMRASGSDDSVYLAPAWILSIERAMEVMAEDDYIEITPKSVRLRKKYLTEQDRSKARRKETK